MGGKLEIEAYPLTWPVGCPRTAKPQRSRFKITDGKAKKNLLLEIERLGGREIIISTNTKLRSDGQPWSNQKTPTDPGVAAYFTLNGEQMVLACDKWNSIGDNMQAIAKTIEASRASNTLLTQDKVLIEHKAALRSLQADNKRLRDALEAYTDPECFYHDEDKLVEFSGEKNDYKEYPFGTIAKKALSSLPAEALEAERRREDVIRAAKDWQLEVGGDEPAHAQPLTKAEVALWDALEALESGLDDFLVQDGPLKCPETSVSAGITIEPPSCREM